MDVVAGVRIVRSHAIMDDVIDVRIVELSRLLFVTIKDVAHEEDLRCIRPLKAVVPCR